MTILLRDSIEGFRSSLSDKAKSVNTIKAYTTDVSGFWDDSGLMEIQLDDLETLVRRWLNDGRKTWEKRTTARKATSLRSYCLFVGVPAALHEYPTPTPAKSEPHPLPNGMDDLEKMILAAGKEEEHILLLVLMGRCGLRVQEALDIAPANFNFTNMTLKVEGKGDKDRVVPIPRDAWNLIQSFIVLSTIKRGPKSRLINYSNRGARKVITRLGLKARISRSVASHDLRMTFATDAYERCKNIRTVQELLGHGHVTTTEAYTYIRMDQMRAAVSRAVVDEDDDDDE